LPPKSETATGHLGTINIDSYKKLLDTLVDITLMSNYDIASNEIGLLNECINLLDIVEKELSISLRSIQP